MSQTASPPGTPGADVPGGAAPGGAVPGDADVPAFRYTAALAGGSSRPGRTAGRRDGTFQAPNPAGAAVERLERRRRPAQALRAWTCSRTPRVPACTSGHPLGYIGTDVLRPLPADDRRQRAAPDGLRRLRPARRAVRGADRAAPADDHRGQHRATCAASCAALGLGHDAAPHVRDHRPGRTTAGPSGSSCRSSTPGTTPQRRQGPPDRRADRRVRVGRPRRRRTAAPWAELTGVERRRAARRAPPGLRQRGPGQLVPGPGHGAGQRGGHRRRPHRARQLPGLPAQPAPVDDADHRVRATGCSPTWTGWTGPSRSS